MKGVRSQELRAEIRISIRRRRPAFGSPFSDFFLLLAPDAWLLTPTASLAKFGCLFWLKGKFGTIRENLGRYRKCGTINLRSRGPHGRNARSKRRRLRPPREPSTI